LFLFEKEEEEKKEAKRDRMHLRFTLPLLQLRRSSAGSSSRRNGLTLAHLRPSMEVDKEGASANVGALLTDQCFRLAEDTNVRLAIEGSPGYRKAMLEVSSKLINEAKKEIQQPVTSSLFLYAGIFGIDTASAGQPGDINHNIQGKEDELPELYEGSSLSFCPSCSAALPSEPCTISLCKEEAEGHHQFSGDAGSLPGVIYRLESYEGLLQQLARSLAVFLIICERILETAPYLLRYAQREAKRRWEACLSMLRSSSASFA